MPPSGAACRRPAPRQRLVRAAHQRCDRRRLPRSRRRRRRRRGRRGRPRSAARSSCAPIVSKATASKSIEASGKVELRTRRETVLADWLRYDVANDEIWAKGDVTLRRGLDWISGPEVKFKREREIGYFDVAALLHRREPARAARRRKSASRVPTMYEATRRAATRAASRRTTTGTCAADEIEVDKLAQGRHRRTTRRVYFLGVPVMYSPWLEFPLSNERKSGFLTPTFGSTQIRGFEVVAPYYFNLAPNYDATLTPRLMTRRGLQIGGQGRYLFEPAAGEADAEILPHDRVTDTDR